MHGRDILRKRHGALVAMVMVVGLQRSAVYCGGRWCIVLVGTATAEALQRHLGHGGVRRCITLVAMATAVVLRRHVVEAAC